MLLIYDGQCGLCVRCARWIAERLGPEARVEPWQSLELDDLGLSRQEVETSVWWLEGDAELARHTRTSPRRTSPRTTSPRTRHSGADAIGHALLAVGGIWAVAGRLIVHPPVRWLARPVYALVAANRHRLR